MFSDDQLHDINLIARFLACDAFAGERPAVGSADLLVLLGNALLPTAWRSFDAVRAGVAPRLLIAGGIGHSTPLLYQALADAPAARGLATAGQAEAPLLAALALRQGLLTPSQIWLESASTNCGENARFARALLQEKGRRRRACCWFRTP
ncbi:ElyC/SanA/YdcF family protein [Edwardsiella piscicida]|nr:ElyC/SanA/YdcF family protein [Edwardsiella piscicida]